MRILLAATRRIHTIAVSLHIAALRVGVWGMERKVVAARKLTDIANIAATEAQHVANFAKYEARQAARLEDKTIRDNSAYYAAARAEAAGLRPGIVL